MRGRYEFMQVLTARTDLGIEFVERFQLGRIAIAVLLPVFVATVIGVLYSAITGDVSSAFTISGKRVLPRLCALLTKPQRAQVT